MRSDSPNHPSTALIGAQVGSFLWMLAVGPLALLLLVVADTGRGRLFAVMSLLMAGLPLAAVLARRRRTKRWTTGVRGGTGLWLGLAAVVAALTPNGRTSGRVAHAFTDAGETFPRFSVGNLLPEGDQLLLGFSIMPLIDPLLTFAQAAELKRLTGPLYRELEADADFHALGSVMSDPYRELLGLPWPVDPSGAEFRVPGSASDRPGARGQSGHTYVYVPAALDRNRPAPLLVFFHGSGGNFKAYLWILSQLADRLGFILAAPSDGFGNWTTEESRAGLAQALAAAGQAATLDRTRVHIAGLSNGGLAVSRLAALEGSRFASLIFLSPVFAAPEIRSGEFAAHCRGRRVLVVTGDQDDRIPLGYVEENATRMTQAGAQVTLKAFPGADHFLVFSHRDRLRPVLEEWLH